jgi:hypothetical protein
MKVRSFPIKSHIYKALTERFEGDSLFTFGEFAFF